MVAKGEGGDVGGSGGEGGGSGGAGDQVGSGSGIHEHTVTHIEHAVSGMAGSDSTGSDSAGSDAGPKWTHRSCRVSAVSIRHQQRVVRDAHTHCAEPTMSATPAKELERCLLGGPMRSALACCAGRPSKAEPFQGAWCRRMAARDSLWGQQHACGGRNEGAPALSIPGLPLSEPAWLQCMHFD